VYIRQKSRRPKLLVAVTAAGAMAAAVCGGTASASASSASHRNPVPVVTGDARVDRLLNEMTLDEKLSMIEGEAEVASPSDQYQAGYLPGVARLGIPSLKLSDGPPGVITEQDSTGMTSTMGVAATFSTADAQANGRVIGSDAKALGQDVVLEPFVNMDRDTSWGRGYNTFGEDPLLTGQTGAAEITGIQSQGEMAQVKHYIAYDGGNDVEVDSQTLQEIYLQPFADAVQAGVSSVMCSYNQVNGYQSCGNSTTLTQILRDELGFKGFVTSDWGANHGTTYINSGLDLEMPGGGGPSGISLPAYFGSAAMKAAIASGSVQVSTIDTAVGRILYEMDRFGLLTGGSKHTVTPENTRADEKTVLATAQDSATLLQNDGDALPLSAASLSSLALIGPGAGQTIATNSGGEAAGGLLGRQTSALSALTSDTEGGGAHIDYAVADDLTGTAVPASALSHDGQPGLLRTTSGSSSTNVDTQLNFTAAGGNALGAGSTQTWTGTLTVPSAGSYWLNIQALGGTAGLTVDGKTLTTVGAGFGTAPRYGVVHATDGNAPTATTDGLANSRTLIQLAAGAHTLSVAEKPDVSGNPVQVRLDWVTPAQQQANTDAAVAAAKKAETAVVFAWDTGSGDLSTALPDGQDQLIEKVAAANPNTIVVLQANQPIAMPWLGSVKSVLDTYYGGDQAGVAAADLLLGRTDPSGHLPFTWPKSLDQEVAHDAAHPERSSTATVTDYTEGLDIGYRYFDATNETPLYPFGYGLSYTAFAYSGMHTTRASDGGLNVTFTVKNTGSAAGTAVPQVYLGAPATIPSGVQFAGNALAAYGRVTLAPGQSRTVSLHVPLRQLQYWTDASGWVTATGNRPVVVGDSERTAQLTATVGISTN
jgi:beta-glucosidase